VTEDFINYALPLIKGESEAVYEDGLPRYAKLKKVYASQEVTV
jgi:6-phosphofructokinase 1